MDVNEVREAAKVLHGFDKIDRVYTFYYDETNNIRRLRVTPTGLNVHNPQCYVLGGVAHDGPIRDLHIDALRSALKIQDSAPEIKLKHLGKGEFIDLLRSPKIAIFLDWIDSEKLFIHHQVLDVMYWSIVDIVDSIITASGSNQLKRYALPLKNDLYTILRYDLDDTVRLFKKYAYPDVGRVQRPAFVNDLRNILEKRCWLLPGFNYQVLKGMLQKAAHLESLPYLEDEKPNILLDEFSMLYINNICLFKNSNHILDIEEEIEARLMAQTFVDNGRPIHNYKFVNSKHEGGIQIADATVGLLGKFFTFINRTELDDLHGIKSQLSPRQIQTLSRLSKLINQSIDENSAFSNRVWSPQDDCKAAFLLDV